MLRMHSTVFGATGVHQIDAITVQFPARFSCGTAEQRMLLLILCWGCTTHTMQRTRVSTAVANLGSKLLHQDKLMSHKVE
jgi:hypothetical protein